MPPKAGKYSYAVYDPSLPIFRSTEIVSSVDRLSLEANQFQTKQNLRQGSKVLEARHGDAVVANAAPSDATSLVHSEDVSMNGTVYHLSAWNTADGIQICSLDLSAGTYTELTSKGNGSHATTFGGDANGKTRLPTATSDVLFMVVTTPRWSIGGVEIPARDVLVVQNGEDYPLIWDPGLTASPFSSASLRMFRHLPINPPQGALDFRQLATMSAFCQVAGTTGTNTYTNSTAARFFTLESTVAPYASGSNFCIKFGATTSAATGDTARITFPNSASFGGNQISFIVEGSSAAVSDLFTNEKLEISNDNVTYYCPYDPSSSDPALATKPSINALDIGGNRYLVTYSFRNIIPWLGLFKHVRFTRKNGAPAANYTVVILAICGSGPGGGFDGGTTWTIAYSDRYAQMETGRIEASARDVELLANIGGPSVVTSGSGSISGYTLTEISGAGINYDYKLFIVGAQGAQQINGGLQQTLNGQLQAVPQCVDLYFRTFNELQAGVDPKFWQRLDLYTPQTSGSDHRWNCVFNTLGVPNPVVTISTQSYGFGLSSGNLTDQFLRDLSVIAPSSLNISMPRASAAVCAGNRGVVGQVKTPTGNYARGDLYFSRRGFPFRFQSIQDTLADGSLDELCGSRVVFDGEIIRWLFTSAASYGGTSRVFVVTDQSANALGYSSPFKVTSFGAASELSTRERLSADGTNEPRSVAEWNGVAMWLNQNGTWVKMSGGQINPVSFLKFDDVAAGIPSARRGHVSAQIWNFRYYAGFTPAGQTTNKSILVWNLITNQLESIDTMAAGTAERLTKAYDSAQNGSGQRLLAYGSDNKVYGYEEGTGAVAVRIVTREMTAEQLKLPAGSGFYIDTIELGHDTDAGKTAAVACVPDFGSTYTFTLNLDAQSGNIQWIQEQDPDTASTLARTVYIDYQSTVTGGKKLREISIEIEIGSPDTRIAA